MASHRWFPSKILAGNREPAIEGSRPLEFLREEIGFEKINDIY